MNVTWVRIRSWHALSKRQDIPWTRCGCRPAVDAEKSDELPAGKSCERCLRIIARDADA